jgi:xanthine phosphoribosyltransferase
MKKRQVSWEEYQGLIAKICRDISNSNWRPDYVVGITRGGLLPAKMISYYFEVPCETLKVQLRDGNSCESNLWMAEDAFGYEIYDPMVSGSGQKKILIVDDINDTGATLNWIINDWTAGCLPDDERWSEVWGNNVRFAVIFDNLASKCVTSMNYSGVEINKEEDPAWIDFPYEDWWTK